jgi:hypothetical protein
MMRVNLNSKTYVLRRGLNRARFAQWAEQLRTSGQQLREDRKPIPLWAPADLTGGAGRLVHEPNENTYWCGTALTLWPKQVTLALLPQTVSINIADLTGPSAIFATAWFKGKLYGVLDGAILGTHYIICVYFDKANNQWLEADKVATAQDHVWADVDIEATTDKIYYTYRSAATTGEVRYSSDGSTWSDAVSPVTATSAGRLTSDGSTLYHAHYDNSTKIVTVRKTDDPALSWTDVGTTATFGVPTAMCMYADEDDVAFPFLAVPHGIYLVDTTNSKLVEYIPLEDITHPDNGRGMCTWNGYLMVPIRDGGVIRYYYDGSAALVGLDSRDGLPTAQKGNIQATYSSRFLFFAAVKGASKSGVYAYDGSGWHPLVVLSTAADILTVTCVGTSDGMLDTTPMLLYDYGDGGRYRLENFHANPLELSGVQYAASSVVVYSFYGAYMPEVEGTYYTISAHAKDLSDGNEYINIYIATDPDVDIDPTDSNTWGTSIGTINATTRELKLGAGSLGTTARVVAVVAELVRRAADDTKTPVLYHIALGSVRHGDITDRLSFQIDVTATAQASGRSTEDIIEELLSLSGQSLLTTMDWQGQPSINVYIDAVATRELQDGARRTQVADLSVIRIP